MRAKTVTHVEYEVFNAILDSNLIAETINELKMELVPEGDKVFFLTFSQFAESMKLAKIRQ